MAILLILVLVSKAPSFPGFPGGNHERHDAGLEGDRFIRGPGQTPFVSRGREQKFRGASDVPLRHLVILTPGGFDGFFAKLAAGRCRIPEDMAETTRIAVKRQLTFTGPPLNAEMQETLQ